jgi:hypothetical protein
VTFPPRSRRRKPGRRRPGYAEVVATLALLFSVTTGAIAAGHYLITSTKQISPKVLAKLKGRRGPTGPRGRKGLHGPLGPTGPKGSPGAGLDGTPFSGDLTGKFPHPTISAGAVTRDKLANDAVTSSKMGLISTSDSTAADSSSPKSLSVHCFSGYTVIGGSATIDDGLGSPVNSVALSGDGLGAFFNGWTASAYETSATAASWRLTVAAICVREG